MRFRNHTAQRGAAFAADAADSLTTGRAHAMIALKSGAFICLPFFKYAGLCPPGTKKESASRRSCVIRQIRKKEEILL